MNWKSPVRIGRQDIVGIGDGQCPSRQPIREIFTVGREKFGVDGYVAHELAYLSEFGYPASLYPFRDINVSIGCKACIMRMYEFAILPGIAFPTVYAFLFYYAFHIIPQSNNHLIFLV